jgi:superoxide dismutase
MLSKGLLCAVRERAHGAAAQGLRSMSTVKLPDLPYGYSALEPYISGQIMELHHAKHHAAYVTNLNKAMEQQAEAEAKGDVAKLIALQSAIKFNGGGGLCCPASLSLAKHSVRTPPQATSTMPSSGQTSFRTR